MILLGREMDFSTVDAFGMGLETGFTLALVNLKGTGGAGVLREAIDSNRSPLYDACSVLQRMCST